MAKKEAKLKKENSKNKKSFTKDFKAELKKVSWLTPKQLINNTVVVITIVLITALIVFILDLAFETLNKHGVDKIKEVVATNSTATDNTTTENITSEDTTTEGDTTDNITVENDESQTSENQNAETLDDENNIENNAE